MNDTDIILVAKEVEKITSQWTDEMINSLIFNLETHLIDKEFKNQDVPPWALGGKL